MDQFVTLALSQIDSRSEDLAENIKTFSMFLSNNKDSLLRMNEPKFRQERTKMITEASRLPTALLWNKSTGLSIVPTPPKTAKPPPPAIKKQKQMNSTSSSSPRQQQQQSNVHMKDESKSTTEIKLTTSHQGTWNPATSPSPSDLQTSSPKNTIHLREKTESLSSQPLISNGAPHSNSISDIASELDTLLEIVSSIPKDHQQTSSQGSSFITTTNPSGSPRNSWLDVKVSNPTKGSPTNETDAQKKAILPIISEQPLPFRSTGLGSARKSVQISQPLHFGLPRSPSSSPNNSPSSPSR
jgi:hypothetical protein